MMNGWEEAAKAFHKYAIYGSSDGDKFILYTKGPTLDYAKESAKKMIAVTNHKFALIVQEQGDYLK